MKKFDEEQPSTNNVINIDFGREVISEEKRKAIDQIRENLDRLQVLHNKLNTMLEELNAITEREKKK